MFCTHSCARIGHVLLCPDIYTHNYTHHHVLGPFLVRVLTRKAFFIKLSLIVTCTHQTKMDQAFNMLKGHFRLHSIAHHNLASPCYPANHRQGLGDAVHLLLEGFRGTAAWRCLGLNSSASPDSHTSCSSSPHPPAFRFLFSKLCIRSISLVCVCVGIWSDENVVPPSPLPPDWVYRQQTAINQPSFSCLS